MDTTTIAQAIVSALGGRDNLTSFETCMTRLRLDLSDRNQVDFDLLSGVKGVLGILKRGDTGLELVFGPGTCDQVYQALRAEINPTAAVPDHIIPLAALRKRRPSAADETSEVQRLVSLLDQHSDSVHNTTFDDDLRPAPEGSRVLVINGPNLNMLGVREPAIYGQASYADLVALCEEAAREAGFASCECFQSNHEGSIVDKIQEAYTTADAIVINPAAYTHTSVALLDAAKAVGLPMVEVHISDVSKREDFRQISYIRAACIKTVAGLGLQGYREAIYLLADHLSATLT